MNNNKYKRILWRLVLLAVIMYFVKEHVARGDEQTEGEEELHICPFDGIEDWMEKKDKASLFVYNMNRVLHLEGKHILYFRYITRGDDNGDYVLQLCNTSEISCARNMDEHIEMLIMLSVSWHSITSCKRVEMLDGDGEWWVCIDEKGELVFNKTVI